MGIAVGHWKCGHRGPRGFGPPPFHEGRGDNKPHEEQMLRMFTKRLDLDDKQQVEVKSIIAEGGERLKALHTETVPKFKEIRQDIEAQLRAVMVGDQVEKFNQLHNDIQKRDMQKRGEMGRRPGPRSRPH